MKFLDFVANKAGVSQEDARDILKEIENEVGHDENLIKAVVDAEDSEALLKRLKKKRKKKEREESISYV
jgi:predicted nucleotidyltransferase